jgi:hypothetical protein
MIERILALCRTVLATETVDLLFIHRGRSPDSQVLLIRDTKANATYAVKCTPRSRDTTSKPSAPAHQARAALAPYLAEHLPEIKHHALLDDVELLFMVCPAERSLHQRLLGAEMDELTLLTAWQNALTAFRDMWHASAKRGRGREAGPRAHEDRYEKMCAFWANRPLGQIPASEWMHRRLTINGTCVPPARELLERARCIPAPARRVTCQGDPQPTNLLVAEDGRWFVIDWEWSGPKQDWRKSMSHIVGWWMTRCSSLRKPATVSVVGTAISLEYELVLNDRFAPFLATAQSMFNALCRSEADRVAFELYRAMLFLREPAFAAGWHRASFEVPCLGEGLRLLAALRHDAR